MIIFSDLWKNFTNNHALPMPTTQSQSNVTIEELKEENNAMQTANGYPISAYQVSEPSQPAPNNSYLNPMYQPVRN